MTDANANPGSSSAGSAEAMPASLTLDEAVKIDLDEPDDEANVKADNTAPETGEENAGYPPEDAPEGDAEDDGDEPDANPGEANQADENATVTVKGETLTVKELTLGYLRERDYRHKTAALGEQSRALKSTAARVTRTADAIAEFLAGQLPEEPSRTLAIHDPAEYTRRKAMFDAGLEQVQAILSLGETPKAAGEALGAEELERKLAQENAALIDAFPELEKPGMREKFFADAFRAGEDLGFSPQEMRAFDDHRYFKVMHWALKGLEADRARTKAMAKVDTAPVIPPRMKSTGKTAAEARNSHEAMQRLQRSGSIRDAMLIDFE